MEAWLESRGAAVTRIRRLPGLSRALLVWAGRSLLAQLPPPAAAGSEPELQRPFKEVRRQLIICAIEGGAAPTDHIRYKRMCGAK